MKLYSSYKDSGIAWIGQIPGHWETDKIGAHFDERKEKVSDKDYKPLSVTKEGIVPQLADAAKTENGDNRKLVCAGDFVVNSRSDRKSSCGVSPYDGSVSLINIILTPRNLNKSYIHYLLRSNEYVEEFYRNGRGIVADLWTTRYSEMKNIFIPIPPADEQEAIVRYITEKSEKIDRYVAEQERLLGALDELRQAEIARAVTRGLNPEVPLRDSGNVWVPKIPEHWKLITVRGVAEIFFKGNGITKLDLCEDGDNVCIRYADIYTKYTTAFSSVNTKTKKDMLATLVYANYGDILFTCTGESIEDIGKSVAYLGNEPLLVGGDIIVMKHSQNPKFLGYALETHSSKLQKGFGKSKLKVVHTSVGDLKNVVFALPPLEEQRAIVEYLDEKTAKIDRMKAEVVKKIDLLKEYKQRMISDAVTGKIDVRE